MRNILMIFTLLVLVAPVFAQNPAGTWTGETSGERGLAVRPITLVLNPDSTGTFEVDVVLDLEEVSIDGSMVAFAVRPMIGGNPAGFRLRYEGEVEGDTMTLQVLVEDGGRGGGGGGPEPLVLTRTLPGDVSSP
jgi:hypothetical protein